MSVLNDMLMELTALIVKESVPLATQVKPKKTLNSRDIMSAVRLVLPGELKKHAVADGIKAVTKFTSATAEAIGKEKKLYKGTSDKAGLKFPVPYFRSILIQQSRMRVGKGAPIFLAAVVEYIASELLELASNAARDMAVTRVTPRHVMLAVRSDQELDHLYKGFIAGGGCLPHIHISLVRKLKPFGSDFAPQPSNSSGATL